ncbi:MAG: hypothetical protein ACFFD9_07340 [Candidatus Thorarchaeota archaeon]
MDINPRLTVSAIGLERTHGPQALADILKCTDRTLPESSSAKGFALFKEYLDMPLPTHTAGLADDYASIMTLPGVVSPPIPIPNVDEVVSPYVCGWGFSGDEAREDLITLERRINQRLGVVQS